MREEIVSYNLLLKRVKKYLFVSGSQFDEEDLGRNTFQRLTNRWLYWFNLSLIIFLLVGEITWFYHEFKTDSIENLTYFIPCITLVLLGCVKGYFLIKNGDQVNDLIISINKGLMVNVQPDLRKEVTKRIKTLNIFINLNVFVYITGLSLFGIVPLILTCFIYTSSGKLEMQIPFNAKYPFDETDIRYWPLAYVHQMWSSFFTVSAVHGSDSFYSLCCTFLQIQYRALHYDIERIIVNNANIDDYKIFKERLIKIIKRHLELNRCISLLEAIYTKSTLLNVVVCPVVMCISALNITIIVSDVSMIPFVSFFIMWLLQLFSLCYYSSLLIDSSTELSDAVYNTMWYKANARIMKDLLLVLTRTQKPCKLTAYGFVDLNLNVFNKVVSTAWSLFAVVRSLYTKS